MKKIITYLLVCFSIFTITGCTNSDTERTISISGGTTVNVGGVVELKATVTPSDSKDEFIWTSSNTANAKVEDGRVTGLQAGITTITVQVKGSDLTAKQQVVVKDSTPVDTEFSYYVESKLREDRKVYVLNSLGTDELSLDELIVSQTIQGLYARDEVTFYVDGRTNTSQVNVDKFYIEQAAADYNLTLEHITLEQAVAMYIASWDEYVESKVWGSQIPLENYNSMGIDAYTETSGEGFSTPGYIVYREGTVSLNVASTLAGITGFIPVERKDVSKYEAMGLVEKFNVDNILFDYQWAFNNIMSELNPDGLIHQDYQANAKSNHYIRDYGVMNKYMYVYYDTEVNASMSFRKSLHTFLTKNMPIFGYTASEDENVEFFSTYGQFIVPTDYSFNLSFFSAEEFHRDENGNLIKYEQPNDYSEVKADSDKHYVSFIVSDGDNATYWQNTAPFSTSYMNNTGRSEDYFPVTWGMTPSLGDLAPLAMQNVYYNQANAYDYFSVPVCGQGYINAGAYNKNNPEAFADYLQKLDIYMQKTDMNSVTIMGGAGEELLNAVEGYSSVDSVIGGVVYSGAKYFSDVKGGVYWANGKPFVGPRDSLWNTTPEYIAARINMYEKDITSVDGYTIINVHPWSHSYDDIRTIVSLLNDDVEVVSMDSIFKLMTDNVTNKTNTPGQFNIPEQNGMSITEGYLQQHPDLIPVNPLFNDFLLWEEDWTGVTYHSSDAAVSDVDPYFKGSIEIKQNTTGTKNTFVMPNVDDVWLSFAARANTTDPTKISKFKVDVTIGNETKTIIQEAELKGVRGTGSETVTGDGWQIFAIPFIQYFNNYKGKDAVVNVTCLEGDASVKIDQFRISQRMVTNDMKYDPLNNEFDNKNTEDIMLGDVYKTSQYNFWGAYDKDTLLPGGKLMIDCSDGGGDEKRNGNTSIWMAKTYTLPNYKNISLDMLFAGGIDSGAMTKVSLYVDGQYFVIQDWVRVIGQLPVQVNLSELTGLNLAGKTVTIVIEGRDSGRYNGVGESWSIDYIKTKYE